MLSPRKNYKWKYNSGVYFEYDPFTDCIGMGLEEWDNEKKEIWVDARNTNPTAYDLTFPSSKEREERLLHAMVSCSYGSMDRLSLNSVLRPELLYRNKK